MEALWGQRGRRQGCVLGSQGRAGAASKSEKRLPSSAQREPRTHTPRTGSSRFFPSDLPGSCWPNRLFAISFSGGTHHPALQAAPRTESESPDLINPGSAAEPLINVTKLQHCLAQDASLDPVLSFEEILIGGLIRSEIPPSRQLQNKGSAKAGQILLRLSGWLQFPNGSCDLFFISSLAPKKGVNAEEVSYFCP